MKAEEKAVEEEFDKHVNSTHKKLHDYGMSCAPFFMVLAGITHKPCEHTAPKQVLYPVGACVACRLKLVTELAADLDKYLSDRGMVQVRTLEQLPIGADTSILQAMAVRAKRPKLLN